MAREQGERVPLLAREGEAPRLRVRDDGAAKASRWSRVAMMASGAGVRRDHPERHRAGVEHGQRSGQRRVERRDAGVRVAAVRGRGAAKQFRPRRESRVNLNAHDGFVRRRRGG